MQIKTTLIDGTLTVSSFKDLKKYLKKIDYKKIKEPNTITKIVIYDSKCDYKLEDVGTLLRHNIMDKLTSIEIIHPDERFCTMNGLLYSKNKKKLYLCPRGRKGTLTIPNGTETICKLSCGYCRFQEVIIPDSVKRIEMFAFHNTSSLKQVIGGKNVEYIKPFAFCGCIRLTSFPFSSTLKNIGAEAFATTSLKKISLPEGLESVGHNAFDTICLMNGSIAAVQPEDMYVIHVPDSLKHIGYGAFANASSIYTNHFSKKLVTACVRSGGLSHCHKCNVWRLTIGDNPEIILPKTINQFNTVTQKINAFLKAKNSTPPELYTESQNSTGLSTAIEHCKLYPSVEVKKFITKNVRTILFNTMLEKNGEQLMVDFIKSEVFTYTALKKILAILVQSENSHSTAVLQAYILNTTNSKKNKKNSFNL